MSEASVAVLLDCENVSPATIDKAMRIASSLGRVTIRRAYGNSAALHKGHEALLQHGFSPCMQFQYVSGKNTADIALALDALELLLEGRAGCYLIVTSDSDFVGLCHKLKERGAMVHIVGEEKSPAALRNACDRFHEYAPAAPTVSPAAQQVKPIGEQPKPDIAQTRKCVVKLVRTLVQGKPDGRVHLSALGQHLQNKLPHLTFPAYGYKTLRPLLESCPQLSVLQSSKGHCIVGLASVGAPGKASTALQLVG